MRLDIDLTGFGPWYGNAVSDIMYFKRSIEITMELDPECIISSHILDPITENIQKKLKTYLSVFDLREKKIIQNIKKGYDTIRKLADLPTIYPRIPYRIYLIFEEFMLEKHLELLLKDGKIVKDDERYKVVE